MPSYTPELDAYQQGLNGVLRERLGRLQQAQGVLGLQGALAQQLEAQQTGPMRQQLMQAQVEDVRARPQERQLQHAERAAALKERSETQLQIARDRIASQIELAQQRGADQRELRKMQMQGQMDLARLAAGLRPAPQPRPLQLTTDAAGNQLIVNSDGTTRPLTTIDGAGVKKTVGADKPMTEFQGKAALYGTRSAQSDKVLTELEDKISTLGLSAAQGMGTAGNYLMSSEQKRVNQAQRDFVNAVLRQESGAVISDAEFANAKKQYFPTPGDDDATIKQKRANRKLAIQGFARMSGPKGAVEIQSIIENPLLPGQPAPTAQPDKPGGPPTVSNW